MGKSKNHSYSVSSVKVKINSKDKTEHNRNPENAPDYEEKMVKTLNKLNGTNHTTYAELPRECVQVPIDALGQDGEPIGKLLNQAIYYVANDEIKIARNCLKSAGMSGLQAKLFCKDEKAVQKRNPKEVAKYLDKPMPEEFKLLTERLN